MTQCIDMYFLTFLSLPVAFSVDSSVGTFSESVPSKFIKFLTHTDPPIAVGCLIC